MMEDWTDIIGEQLENIEEPLPADDWSVLQQKYAASQKKKRAVVFAWAGGFTSIAAAIAIVLQLFRPSTVIPDMIGDQNNHIAETLPPAEEIIPTDTVVIDAPADSLSPAAPPVKKKAPAVIDVIKKTVDDLLIAEDSTEEISPEDTEDTLEVVRDTTSLNERLLADASDSDKNPTKEDEYTPPTGTFGFEDFPEEKQRKRRPMSIGLSGAASGTPMIRMMEMGPTSDNITDPNGPDYGQPGDSTVVETPQPTKAIMKSKKAYKDSYEHDLPISVGLSARFFLTERLSINTGLNYTKYSSTRNRFYKDTHTYQKDRQHAHYLGIPVRLDWTAVNRKNFNFYLGAGVQMDKCIYAKVADERLRERQFLFGVNGAMGIQVNIIPQLGLYLEPEISYSLNEGTIKTFRSREPFMISARAGLRFNF